MLSAAMIVRLVFVCAWLILFNTGYAATESDSEIWLYYSQDEFQEKTYLTSMSLAINDDEMIFINIGHSESEFFGETISTNQVSLGLSSFRLMPFAVDGFYEYWGKQGELEIDTVGLGIMYYADDWSFGIPVEYQNIEFFSRESSRFQHRFTVKGYGLGLNFQLTGEHLSWSFSAMRYGYSEDLQKLSTSRALFLLGAKNLNHVTIINDWLVSSSLRYRWTDTSLSLLAVHSVSAIDQAESNNAAVNLSIDVTPDISLLAEIGRTFERFDLATDYASVGIGFRF